MRKTFITISSFLLFLLFIFSTPKAFAACSFLTQPTYTTDDNISVTANNLTPQLAYTLSLWKPGVPYRVDGPRYVNSDTASFSVGKLAPGTYNLELTGKQGDQTKDTCLGKTNEGYPSFTISVPQGQARIKPTLWTPNPNGSTECVQNTSGLFNTKEDCENNISQNTANPDYLPPPPPLPCAEGEDKAGNLITKDQIKNNPYLLSSIVKCTVVNTAIGDISADPAGFVKRIFSLVLGLAGGIALILIIISGYKFMASAGNPEAVKAATEGLTSAVIGLLFIIFAFVILQIIGVDILRIPGFAK